MALQLRAENLSVLAGPKGLPGPTQFSQAGLASSTQGFVGADDDERLFATAFAFLRSLAKRVADADLLDFALARPHLARHHFEEDMEQR